MKLKHAYCVYTVGVQPSWYSQMGTAKRVQPGGGKTATCAYQVETASASALRDSGGDPTASEANARIPRAQAPTIADVEIPVRREDGSSDIKVLVMARGCL